MIKIEYILMIDPDSAGSRRCGDERIGERARGRPETFPTLGGQVADKPPVGKPDGAVLPVHQAKNPARLKSFGRLHRHKCILADRPELAFKPTDKHMAVGGFRDGAQQNIRSLDPPPDSLVVERETGVRAGP